MVGVKTAQTERPVKGHAGHAAEDRHLELPPLDRHCSDDFRELADCQLVIGDYDIKCHSQVGFQFCQGCVMQKHHQQQA